MLISLLEFVSLFKRLITTQIIQITPFSNFSFPVIAVMFTFSFNTAFAAGVDSFDKNLAERYFEIAMEAAKDAGSVTVTQNDGTYEVSYATLNAYKAELLDAVLDYDKNTASSYVQTADDLKEVLKAVQVDGSYVFTYDVAMTLVAAQFAAEKDSALTTLKNLDLSDFSDAEMDEVDADGCKTYKEHVQFVVNQAIKDINDADNFNSDSNVKAYADAQKTIAKYFDKYDATSAPNTALAVEKGYDGNNGDKVGLGIYEINKDFETNGKALSLYTKEYVEAQGALSDADVAAQKAAIAQAYAHYVVGKTAAEKEAAANVKTVLDFLVGEKVAGLLDATATSYAWYFENTVAADVEKALANVEAFKAEAARLAAETDSEGKLVRNADDVEKLVIEGTKNEYLKSIRCASLATKYRTIPACIAAIEKLYVTLDAEKLAYAKKLRETYIAELLEGFEDDGEYYPLEMGKVKALTEEYLAKVNAVTELSKVNKYDVEYLGYDIKSVGTLGGKLDAVKTAADVDKLSGVKALVDTTKDYLELINKSIAKNGEKYDVSFDYAKLTADVQSLVGNSEARTTKDIAALSDQAVALIKSLPTVNQVADAKEAMEDAIAAVPTGVITSADKAVIDTAIAAEKAYRKLVAYKPAKDQTLQTAITKLAYAVNNEIKTKADSVVRTDKEAVKALKAEIKAFTDVYGNKAVFSSLTGTLDGYLAKIQQTEATAVRNAIVAIPVNPNLTAGSEAKVTAARKAYNAYVEEYTDYTDYNYDYTVTTVEDGFVADDFDFATIVNSETLLGLNAEDPALAVKSMKLRAYSKYAKKGITVKWVIEDGRKSDAKGYQVWRSTKANTGYKKLITVNPSYGVVNAKNLKKGVTYYYKVRAYNRTAEGKLVFSDWSNKAYRKAK